MGFQIKNDKGIALSMNELDKEAAEFWGVPVHETNYAHPCNNSIGNWFDTIGFNIHRPGTYTSGWRNVIVTMYQMFSSGYMIDDKQRNNVVIKPIEEQIKRITDINEFMSPYVGLVNHWIAKGYTCHQTNN